MVGESLERRLERIERELEEIREEVRKKGYSGSVKVLNEAIEKVDEAVVWVVGEEVLSDVKKVRRDEGTREVV